MIHVDNFGDFELTYIVFPHRSLPHIVVATNCKYLRNLLNMWFILATLDYHVINIGFHSHPQQVFKHIVNHLLISSPNIFQPKGQDIVAVHAFLGDERSFLNIQWELLVLDNI